jgi:hypothetical protein
MNYVESPAVEEVSRATRVMWGEHLMTAPPRRSRNEDAVNTTTITTTTTFGPVSTQTRQRTARQVARSPR